MFKCSQVTLSSSYLVFFYLRLMSCIWAVHQKERAFIKLNHCSTVCPGKWRVFQLLNNFRNFIQNNVCCRRINCQYQCKGLMLLEKIILLLVEP